MKFNSVFRREIEYTFETFEKFSEHFPAQSLHCPLVTMPMIQYFLSGHLAKVDDMYDKDALQHKFYLFVLFPPKFSFE